MATRKQRTAAQKNIKKAAKTAKRKQTLKHLPKKTRRALGQQAAKPDNHETEPRSAFCIRRRFNRALPECVLNGAS
jgi:hypothetical protein